LADEKPSGSPTEVSSTAGGISAVNTVADRIVYRVSPTTDALDNGTVRMFLRPIGCVRIDDSRFDFDSSFLLPDTTQELALLAARRPVSARTLLTVFGHADPVNNDDYNKELSTRRAKALYGLLVRDVELWQELFQNPHEGDAWNHGHICVMLNEIGFPTPLVKSPTAESRTAVRNFQKGNALPGTGDVDRQTRSLLFASYMDAICLDAAGVAFQYKKQDFLSRNAAGTATGVPDFQGCSEFNPVFVLSESLDRDLSDPKRKAQRNAINSSNRRVVVYVFPEDVRFPLDKWPCPAKGTAGCRKQFWKDGDERRKPKQLSRQYLFANNTFACKFYDRLTRGSPCEAVRQTLTITLQDDLGKLMPDEPFRLTLDAEVREGRSNADGQVIEDNIYLGPRGLLEWGEDPDNSSIDPNAKVFRFRRTIFFDLDQDDAAVIDRQLHNLAIVEGDRAERLALLREHQQLGDVSDDQTSEVLAQVLMQGGERPDPTV
jgi:hypothetical protein